MKIVLADPPFGEIGNKNAVSFPNLGILYLISFLRNKVKNLEIHYIKGFLSLADHLKEIEAIHPDIYGISFSSVYAALSYRTINAAKKIMPDVQIICGGAHPTIAFEEVFKNSSADICCLGEGEETFVELIKQYLSNKDFTSVLGIAYRDGKDIKKNQLRPLIENLDDIPFPAWDYVNFEEFQGCRKYRGTPSTAIIASRGCPFDCIFCSNPVWKLQKPWIRTRSPLNIAQEVTFLYSLGIREISIQSDEMNPDYDWCENVFKALKELRLSDLYFQCNLRGKPVTHQLAEALNQANCWLVYIGLESANNRVLDGMKKMLKLEDIIKAFKILKKHKIKVFVFLMMYQVWEDKDKFYVETQKEINKSLLFLLNHWLRRQVHFTSCSITTPLPGSRLHNIAKKYSLIDRSSRLDHGLLFHEISMTLPNVPKYQIAISRAKGLLLQGLFFLTSREPYRRKLLLENFRYAIKKMIFIFRPY